MAQGVARVSEADGLARHLQERIAAEGPIGVDAFMEAALFDPRWGFYANRDPLGARGDFITAPEVSQVFGELIGLWLADLWQRTGAPEPLILAELGPGRGTLLADALRAARAVPGFRRAARLHLVERSPVLRRRQAEVLGDAAPEWHTDFASLPPGPLFLVANEFLDALPVRQFVRLGDGWHERRVGWRAGRFVFVTASSPCRDHAIPAALADAPLGSLCETRPAAAALAHALGARLAASGGAALLVDYGHVASACGDTLQAVRRHRTHAVLDEPGTADLTAHVDFAAFAAAAVAAGVKAWGPVAQGAFLRALGIVARTEALTAAARPEQARLLASGTRRLVDPAAMGGMFKVLALTHRDAPAAAGFDVGER
ncbi:MAG TPA: SAM-dependent methyltransferase [Stellaceae bacterium]|nr:SAM-dependent methyltransferase [Stellaceae bacterium]